MRKVFCRLASLIDERNLKLAEDNQPSAERLSQRKLASETGVSKTAINRLFNNDFTRVDTSTITSLCNYFGCEVGDLFVMKEVSD